MFFYAMAFGTPSVVGHSRKRTQTVVIHMNPWKISTLVLAFLLFVAMVLYLQQPQTANSRPANSATTPSEIAKLREAANDTQSFLNWYRMNQDDGITAEVYEINVNALRNRYIHHFPEWARNSP